MVADDTLDQENAQSQRRRFYGRISRVQQSDLHHDSEWVPVSGSHRCPAARDDHWTCAYLRCVRVIEAELTPVAL